MARLLILLAVTAQCTTSAWAWAAPGHMLIGALATDLLNSNARRHVRDILGYDLATASKWPDCVRNVARQPDGTFQYVINPKYQPPCDPFMNPHSEVAGMEDYASRNWTNCDAGTMPCGSAYHFADIPIQRRGYGPDEIGANGHDVVHAIQAAVDVLRDRPAPPPFSIKNKKEALFLLAHFVGDIHQPLHVGAIYLTPGGNIVDPADPSEANMDSNAGGNAIQVDGVNFHTLWDGIPSRWEIGTMNETDRADFLAQMRSVPRSAGPMHDWPVAWATESVQAAKDAYSGFSFAAKTSTSWAATPPPGYEEKRIEIQKARLIKAAARLAALLNAIWPQN